MNLLSIYTNSYGTAVKKQGSGFNGPCPLCGGEPGKSDRFIIWPERSENLGEACAKHGIHGVWSCRQCGAGGDTIAYLMQVEGLNFKQALAELGIEGGHAARKRRAAPSEPKSSTQFTAPEISLPHPKWLAYAAKLVDEAADNIWQQPQALRWLAHRGLDAAAVQQYKIGYLSPEGKCGFGRFRHRSALNLEPKLVNGKEKKLFIPRGIVIPSFALDGSVINIRIRRHKEDLTPMPDGRIPPKYLELEGSSRTPMLLRANGLPALSAYFITEAELDAILIHHATGGAVGAMAVRTNRGKPDATGHALLVESPCICIALDYDEAGAQGVEFWEENYAQAKRWPTPQGKDPGDAFALGVDIRAWVQAALPRSLALPELEQKKIVPTSIAYDEQKTKSSCGSMEACSSGLLIGGAGAKPIDNISLKEDDTTMPTSEHKARKRHWSQATAQTPLTEAVLPQGAPSVSALRSSFAGKDIHDEILVSCPKHNWFWVHYFDKKRNKFGCDNCSGHSQCIVEFQLSEQMRAPEIL